MHPASARDALMTLSIASRVASRFDGSMRTVPATMIMTAPWQGRCPRLESTAPTLELGGRLLVLQ